MGSALFAFASARNSSFIFASRSGSFAARSSAWEKSFVRSYSSHTSLFASQPFSSAAVLGSVPRDERPEGAGEPAVVVDAAAGVVLEVLRLLPARAPSRRRTCTPCSRRPSGPA